MKCEKNEPYFSFFIVYSFLAAFVFMGIAIEKGNHFPLWLIPFGGFIVWVFAALIGLVKFGVWVAGC